MSDKEQKPKEEDKKTQPKSVALYVLASGPKMGATVEVVPVGETIINPETGEQRTNLALTESPDKVYQTKAVFSKKKEPGTWHYL